MFLDTLDDKYERKAIRTKMEHSEKSKIKERKDQGLYIRMTKSEMEALELATYASEDNKSDVVRKALKTYFGILGMRLE